MPKMTRAGINELARAYAERNECTIVQAETYIRNTLEIMRDSLLQGEGIFYMNNFIIDVVERKEKRGANPNTGEIEMIPAYKTLKIKTGQQLKQDLNAPK